jgi:nitrite reductase/ring-hydroxylating ferredoxin subunit
MADEQSSPKGPDLTAGVTLADIPDGGMVGGHVGEEPVLLARRGQEMFALGSTCSHYGGPLAEGLIVGETVRCPWHHACFSLRTGEAVAAPAFNPMPCWRVETRNGKAFVREKMDLGAKRRPAARSVAAPHPDRVVIVGGGAAGFAAAELLRREGFAGSLTMFSSDDAAPYDRPNCSKDYLAGKAPEDWMPLRPLDYFKDEKINLRLGTQVSAIDPKARQVLANGQAVQFDSLLLATGAEPVRLDIVGTHLPHVHVLRSLADSRAIIAAAKQARRAVIIGASFIGLEVAAALRARAKSKSMWWRLKNDRWSEFLAPN